MANVNPNSIGWDFKQLTSGKGDKKFGEGTEGGNGNGNGNGNGKNGNGEH